MTRTLVVPSRWRIAGGRHLTLSAPVVMGVLNLTPDSFSDGGALAGRDDALARARALIDAGAAILDVGGESTRPGAPVVPADEELRRVVPFIREASRRFDVPISVDTRKASVAAAAVDAGAAIVNDVSGLAFDAGLGRVVADAGAGLVLMHMRGTPADMLTHAHYLDLSAEVRAELEQAVARARAAGIAEASIVLDPGIGFAKTAAQSLAVLAFLEDLIPSGFPVLVGPSRKSFLGQVLGVPPAGRVAGTVAACVVAYLHGARVFRVHDVRPVAQALAVAHAIRSAREPAPEGEG